MKFNILLAIASINFSFSALSAERRVITDKVEMEAIRSELAKSWISWKPSKPQTDIIEIAAGTAEEGDKENLCEYEYEKMIYTSRYIPGAGYRIEREMFNWDLGPKTTANEDYCEAHVNDSIDDKGMSYGMQMFLNIDKLLSTIGQMAGVITEAKLIKITTQDFSGVPLYHFTYYIKGTTSDDLDIDIPGMGDPMPDLPFELKLTVTFAKEVTPAALLWQVHTFATIAGVEKEASEQGIVKFNGVGVPAFEF